MSKTNGEHGNSRYTLKTAAAICWQLTEGKSLREICKQPDMPAQPAVFRWIEAHEDFRKQYARARELQAHVLADETLGIADDTSGDYREVDGKLVPDYENVQRARLRVDARRWMAGKLLPKVYGDKMLHTGGDGEGPVQVKLSLDYSRLEPHELVQFRALIAKAQLPAGAKPLMIEGEAEEDDSD